MRSYRFAVLAYVVFFLALTFRYWGLGEVIAPHRQAEELGMSAAKSPAHPENRKFSDYTSAYVPETQVLLHGRRSGWLALWTEQNELGRPLYQLSGFSPAYAPSAVLALLTDEPTRFITVLSLSTCFLGGFFALLLCRELRLSPLAGAAAAVSLGASPFFMYWLTFPVFPAVWTWSAATLFAITRLARQRDKVGWIVFAFSTYSLLITAYPQPVVFHLYIFFGYGAVLMIRQWRQFGGRQAGRFVLALVTAGMTGLALCIPLYIDLFRTAADSTRISADAAFFSQYLPRIETPAELARFLTLTLFPEILGNPVLPSFVLPYDGLSISPIVLFFAICGLLLALRTTWGWGLAVVTACVLSFHPPAYIFGVNYLGFKISPSTPLGTILLPLIIIAAYGVDRTVTQQRNMMPTRWAAVAAAVCSVAGLAGAIAFAVANGLRVDWHTAFLAGTVMALLLTVAFRPHPLPLCAALSITVVYSSAPLMLHQDRAQIAMSSALVSAVRSNLPPDSRYAVLSPGLSLLPPNLNASIGLSSVHSYNSLSSYRYRTLLKELGGDASAFGRWNDTIHPDFDSIAFWMSNIGVVLSPALLPPMPALQYVGSQSNAHIYRVLSRMGCCLQVPKPHTTARADGGISINATILRNGLPITKTNDQGDFLEFDIPQRGPSILVLSQKYHSDWQAQALTGLGWADIPTVPVNEIFQGAVLPEDAREVRMHFKPYARFAWFAHGFWLFALAVLIFPFAARHMPAVDKKRTL